jgi:hypothetical protein
VAVKRFFAVFAVFAYGWTKFVPNSQTSQSWLDSDSRKFIEIHAF